MAADIDLQMDDALGRPAKMHVVFSQYSEVYYSQERSKSSSPIFFSHQSTSVILWP